MPKIDETTENIIFDPKEYQAAWNNAPKLINLDPKEHRLCYFCKLSLDYDLPLAKTNSENQSLGWVIDLINAKNLDFSYENLVAVHYGCLSRRKKMNQKREFEKVNRLLWKYNE